MKMNNIEYYQKCHCGAITLFFDDGASSSMRQETFDAMNIDLSDVDELPESYCCNHCANHWGIDICECGSGEPVGKCSCGSHNAMQQLGVEYDSFSKIIRNIGHGY